jgi:hypothetical protein
MNQSLKSGSLEHAKNDVLNHGDAREEGPHLVFAVQTRGGGCVVEEQSFVKFHRSTN